MKYLRDEEGVKMFGARVRELRKGQKMSMETLANTSGLEYSQISRIERGMINTSISHVFIIAKALSVEPSELFNFSINQGRKGR